MDILKENKYWDVFRKKLVETQWKDYTGKRLNQNTKRLWTQFLRTQGDRC